MLIESSVKYVFAQTHTRNSIHIQKQTHITSENNNDIGSGLKYWLLNKKRLTRGKYFIRCVPEHHSYNKTPKGISAINLKIYFRFTFKQQNPKSWWLFYLLMVYLIIFAAPTKPFNSIPTYSMGPEMCQQKQAFYAIKLPHAHSNMIKWTIRVINVSITYTRQNGHFFWKTVNITKDDHQRAFCILWGDQKVSVHLTITVQYTSDELKMAITEYIRNVDRAILNTVFENTVRRVNKCLETGGGHYEHYL